MYVPNGNHTKRVSISAVHYSDNEHSNGLDNEMDTDQAIKLNNNINKVKQEVGDLNMNIISQHGDDDDTSTVENILFTTLNSPTTTVSSANKSLSFIETSVPGAG